MTGSRLCPPPAPPSTTHTTTTSSSIMVKVSLRGAWVAGTVGADPIGYGAAGLCWPLQWPVGPPAAVGKRGRAGW